MDRLNNDVWCRCQEAVDEVRAGDWLRRHPAVALELGPHAGKGEQRPVIVQCEPHHVPFLSLGWARAAYSAKLLDGTRQRFSCFSHARQCGDADVSHRKIPGARRRGIPQPIIAVSRPLSVLRTTGMNWQSEDSRDGRYFGLVPNSPVIGKALPVWTREG
jgi:hypothetical protein